MHVIAILALSLISLLNAGSEATLTFVGDAMQHSPQITAAARSGGRYDYSTCFTLLEPTIQAADLAVVNLECPLAGKPYTGYPCFSAPDSYARQLIASGFDLIVTANNHCLDRGAKGLRRTCTMLDSMHIPHVGTYRNATERAQRLPLIRNVNGINIGFLNYTYGTNGIPARDGVVVDFIDRDLMARDIAAARQAGAQALCVVMHWGIEYTLKPVKSERSLADFLVDQGVDLIIGGHPHVVQPMEMRHSDRHNKDVLLVYSLGNFISNQRDIDCRGGALVNVTLRIKDGHPVVCNPKYGLFFVQKPAWNGDNFQLIPENRPDLVRADQRSEFNSFMSRTHSLVTAFNKGVGNLWGK